MTELDNLICTINPYSMAFKMVHGIEKEEYKKAEKCGLIPKEVKMYMVRNDTLDKKNNGAVADNEVAIVYVGEMVFLKANEIFVFILKVQMHVGYLLLVNILIQ